MIPCLSHFEIETLLNSEDETPSDVREHLDSCEICLTRMQQVLIGGNREGAKAASENGLASIGPESPPEVSGYVFEKVIGFGGMGSVWKAVQQSPRRTVAVKFIRGKSTDRAALDRMKQEADAAARLQHQNVVTLYEFREDPIAGPFLTMEYVPGGTLADRMQAGPYDPVEACELVRRLAEAVGFANSRNVIHRDLKPTNILLAEDGTPKISDFGIARLQDEESAAKAEIIGTPHYMAPEQARGETVDGRADVYSLGVILFEMVTGQTPFIGDTVAAVLLAVQRTEPPRAGRLRAGLPTAVETICEKCLQRYPDRRYASAFELAGDLDRFLSHRPILAKRTSLTRRVYLFTRRNRAVTFTAIAALVLLSIAVPYAIVMRSRSETDRQTATEAKGKVELAETKTVSATDKAWSALGLATDETIEIMFARQKRLTSKDKTFLERVIERYDEVAKLTGDTPSVQFRKAVGIYKVAGIRKLLGETPKAEQGYREALTLLERLLATDPDNRVYAASRAGVTAAYAKLQTTQDRFAEGEQSYRNAIDEQMRISEPNEIESDLLIASWWADLAEVLRKTERFQESIIAYDNAIKSVGIVRSAQPSLAVATRREALYQTGKAASRRMLQTADIETETLLKTALAEQLRLVEIAPEDFDLRLEVTSTYQELAEYYRFANRNDDASSVLSRAAQIHDALAVQFPSDPDFRLGQANAFDLLGRVTVKKDVMASYLRKAEELHRKLCKEFPKDVDFQIQLSRSQVALAEHLADNPPNAKPYDKAWAEAASGEGLSWSLNAIKPLRNELAKPPLGQIFIVHRNATKMCERFSYAFYGGDLVAHLEISDQFKNAEGIATQVSKSNARNPDARLLEAWVVQRRAHWESRRTSAPEGIKQYQRAIQLYRELIRDFDGRSEFQRLLAECLVAAASENYSIQKEAIRRNGDQLLEALQIANRLLKPSTKSIVLQSLVARANYAFGKLFLDTEPGEADPYLQKAASVREALAKAHPNSVPIKLDYADSLLTWSQSLAARQSGKEALRLVGEAKKIYTSLKAKDLHNQRSLTVSIRDCDVVIIHVALMSQGDYEVAIKTVEGILSDSVHEQLDNLLAICTYASAVRLSSGSKKLTDERKAELRKEYVAKVISSMNKLKEKGFASSPYVFEHQFRELEAIKDDPEYRKIVPPISTLIPPSMRTKPQDK